MLYQGFEFSSVVCRGGKHGPSNVPTKQPQRWRLLFFQKRVSLDLVQKIGRDVIKLSLRTKVPSEAKIRHAAKLQELEREWASLRSDVLTLNHRQVVALTKQSCDLLKDPFGDNPPGETAIQTEWDMRAGGKSGLISHVLPASPANAKKPHWAMC